MTFRTGWRFAAKAYLVTLAGVLLLRANVFLLERIAGSATLGQFSIASQVAEAIGAFPAAVALVLFPRLVRQTENNWRTSVRTMAVVGLVLLVTCAAIALLADPLIRVAFGQRFAPAVEPLQFLLPGVVALGMLTVMSQFLGAVGLPVALVAAWAGALVLVVILGLALVPAAGASGAAISLSIAYVALLGAVVAIALRYRPA